MSLNWDVRDVENSDTVCFHEVDGERRLRPVTEALIFGCMGIGIGEITKNNWKEVHKRHCLLGGLMGVPTKFTEQDIVNHIGLSTNVFPKEPLGKWVRRMMDNIDYLYAEKVKNGEITFPKTVEA